MASVEKLLVRGIRSFGPNDDDAQMVRFTKPLTIILGQNGCGKTTIIEALKYATCGDLPGNCNLGAGFVHDPKLCNCTEVRGQIKLEIRDLRGKPVFVSRSMQCTQKLKKLQFKSVDQTITRKDPTGQAVSISGRCTDVDTEMCLALGVTKAILHNVIFCHQEDSNWPLDEAKKLKEKFDAIFDVVKYNKCLENLKLQRKVLKEDISSKRNNLTQLLRLKDEASAKKARLSEEEARFNGIQDRITEFDNELEPIKRRLNELISREMDIGQLITEREKKNATLKAIQSNIQDYQKAISVEFQGTLEDLLRAIEEFRDQSSQQESKLRGLEGELKRADTEEQRLTRQLNSEQVKLGQLTRDEEQNMERIEQRNRALNLLSDQLDLSSSVLTEGDVVRSLAGVERSVHAAEARLEAMREAGDADEATKQRAIDDVREDKTRLEQQSQLKSQQINTNQQETKRVKAEIDEVNQSTEKLNRLQQQLERNQKAADDLSKAVDLTQLDQDITSSQARRDKLEDELTSLDREVRELQSVSQIQTELNVQLEAKAAKEAEIRKLRNKTEDSLLHLLGNIPESGIKHQLQSCIDRLAHDIRTTQSRIAEKQRQLATLETDRKHLKAQQQEKTRALAQDQEELYDACESRDYQAVLDEVTTQVDNIQDEKGTLKASEFMFRRYVDKLKRDKPCCPLCHRGFQEAQESADLITELEGRMQGLPRTIDEKERELERLLERQSRLQQLRPTYERIGRLRDTDIPAIQSQLEGVERKLEAVRQELSQLQNDLISPQTDEAMAKAIQGDVALLDQHQSELKRLDQNVKKLQERMPKGGSNRTLQEATDEQDKLRNELQSLRKSLQSAQSKRDHHNQQLHKLQSEKNTIVEQQLKIQGGVQQKKQLEDRLEELQVAELMLLEEFDRINDQIAPVNERLEAAIRDKETTRAAHKRAMEQERAKVNNLVSQCNEIRKTQEAIARYDKSGGSERLAASRQSIGRLEREKETVLDGKRAILAQMDEVKANLVNQQVRERELDDNLKLRQKRKEEEKIKGEVLELSTKIGGMDLRKVSQEKEKLVKKQEDILREKAHTEGRKRELQDNIHLLRKELQKDEMKNAEKRYSDELIQLRVTEAAHSDLATYSKALEWALNHFHNQRMKHINDIIGDLWTQIYAGNDIDTISIRNDEDLAQAQNRDPDKRKNYNYRVVQIKNGQELDMRGRCSAGQKMLACLIIRMALAEIFSTKCGILTLDEPTTNLDRDNIDRLCSALVNLINIRSTHRSNFQLIVITHDEEFIDKLTKMHKVDYYFQVTRNERGVSVVNKVQAD